MATRSQWSSLATLTSGISTQTISAGANYLGSEIDNTVNRYRYLALEAYYDATGTAPAADKTLEFYLIAALDGTNYEDGDATPTDPKIAPIHVFACRNVDINRQSAWHIPIPPCKFKILVKSELDQEVSLTVDAYAYSEEA